MLTRSWGKALLIAALLLVALVASAGWYLAQHSMDAVSGFEVNDPQATQRVRQLLESIDAVIRVPVEST
jgi:hypothetical protein